MVDLNGREKLLLVPLAGMVILLGVFPSLITDITGPAVQNLIATYEANLSTAAEAAVDSVEDAE